MRVVEARSINTEISDEQGSNGFPPARSVHIDQATTHSVYTRAYGWSVSGRGSGECCVCVRGFPSFGSSLCGLHHPLIQPSPHTLQPLHTTHNTGPKHVDAMADG